MKLNWFSNAPWTSVGYGVQTRLFAPRIRNLGHEVSMTAFYGLQGAPIGFDGMKVYPVVKHPYGQDVMNSHAIHAGAEAIISLLDIWVVQPQGLTLPWFPWYPIDHEPIPNKVLEMARQATKGIVMSKFGLRMAQEAGLDSYYVPHGVDTKTFYPTNQQEARARLGFPADAFIVGMVAANKGNPPRKAFFEQIAAFAELKKKHSDALLYLHTDDGTRGGEVVNLVQYCQRLGLRPAQDVVFVDQYANALGLADPYMRDAYNSMDVMTLASLGEGFGIPLIEAQACGCPVITGAWTAMGELVFGGWKIPKTEAQPEYHDYFDAYQWRVNVGAVVDRLEEAYQMRGVESLRQRARDGAMAYDADRVTEKYWKPVLADIERMVSTKAEANTCAHEWLSVGLYNRDGSISVPCRKCGSERIDSGSGHHIVPSGFVNATTGITYADPDGLEWLLTRETVREYDHGLNLPAQPKVIDIGAHVGVVSMYLAKKYGAEVWAFEPHPENYRRLCLNIQRNGLEGVVHAFNAAVTSDGRKVTIGGGGDNSGGNSIYSGMGETAKSTTLSAILKLTGPVDLFKIDCEGAEFEILRDPEILRGMTNIVRGEVHNAHGDGKALVEAVKAVVPNTDMVVLKAGA